MSWSFAGHRGSLVSKTSGQTLALTPSQAVPVGAVLVAVCVADNISTVNGQSSTHILADFLGNPWQKVVEATNGGGAGTGITASVFIARLRRELGITDPVIFGTRSSVTSRAIGLYEYGVGAGNTFRVVGGDGTVQGNTTAPSVTLNGLASAQYAFFGVVAREGDTAGTYTPDSDYNDRTKFGTTGGGGASNVSAIIGDRIGTLAGDTFAPTNLSAAADTVSLLFAFQEVPMAPGSFVFNESTAVQLRARLRELYRTATPSQLCRLAVWIEAQAFSDAQYESIFGVTTAQLPMLKTRIANQAALCDALRNQVGC